MHLRSAVPLWVALLVVLPVYVQSTAEPVVSPDIAANLSVTFRIAVPTAVQVSLASGGDIPQVPVGGLPMAKNAEGTWEVTLPPDPGAYRYFFNVDVFGISGNDEWEQAHLAALDDAALKNGLKLVWFSTGIEDFLIETTRATVSMIEKHGFDIDYTESGGGHTWINWREYMNTFVPQLFK